MLVKDRDLMRKIVMKLNCNYDRQYNNLYLNTGLDDNDFLSIFLHGHFNDKTCI